MKGSTPVQNPPQKVPKIIWMMWLQGFDKAPFIVKECYKSWVALNPGWEVILLDEHSVHEYIDVRHILATDNNLQIQAHSDIMRLNLLASHGGVWADATCFCRKPLDSWIEKATASGFFAFYKPSKIKLMDNWFMASHKDCYLTQRLREEASRYWLTNSGLTRHRGTLLARVLKVLLNSSIHTTKYWFSFPVRKLAKSYPYPWFQFLFTKLVSEDARFREIWDKTPKISADTPHKLQRLGLTSPLTEAAKREIDEGESPLYKLTWKYNTGKYDENCVLYYLLNAAQTKPDRSPTDGSSTDVKLLEAG